MLCGSECWAINNADIQWIDAVDQWCLRRILDIRLQDFVRNADIRRITNQPSTSLADLGFLCPVLSTEIILRLDSYSTITRQTRFIKFKSQFILRITRQARHS